MNRSASGKIRLTLESTLVNLLDSQVPATCSVGADFSATLNNGIEADQFNRAWASGDRALSSGASETLDLYQMTGMDIGAGAGNDGLGLACLFEEIVAIVINVSAGTGALEIEPGGASGLTALGILTAALGGALSLNDSLVRIARSAGGIDLSSTKKNVKFTANGGPVTYSVTIFGRHDDEESSSSSSSSTSSLSSSSTSSVSSESSSSTASSSTTSTLSSVSSSSTSSVSSSSTSSASSSSSSTSTASSSSSSSS